MSISFVPYTTTNITDSFQLLSDGFVQGTYQPSPPGQYYLEGGVVASTQSTPIYGGLPISLAVTAPGTGGVSSGLGQAATVAVSEATIDGWCVFNQASAGVITSSSNVPLYSAGQSINFVRVGSGLWVVLPVKSDDVATIAGGASNQAIYWDFTNNWVAASGSGALGYQIIALNTNSLIVNYAAGPPITANWKASSPVILVRV